MTRPKNKLISKKRAFIARFCDSSDKKVLLCKQRECEGSTRPNHADKWSARAPLACQNACVLYEASFFIKLIHAYKIKLTPFLTEFPPFPFPLLQCNKESTESLKAGTLSVSQSGAFSNCVTRFRGGALRHAKFPKTSYCLQLLDTLKHGRCVGQNRSRGRGIIFLSGKVLVLSWAKRRRFVGRGTPSHSHLSSSPKSPDGYRFAILALTVKLWLAVLCARLLKGLRLFVGFACCQIMANWASMLKILAKSR